MAEGGEIRRAHELLKQHRYVEVVDLLGPYVHDHPDDARAWQLLGAAHFGLGQWKPSEEAAARVVQLCPSKAEAWANWGMLLRKLGKLQEARLAQMRATELDPTCRHAQTELRKLALLFRKDSRLKETAECPCSVGVPVAAGREPSLDGSVVRCPKCSSANRVTDKYCWACESPLVCPKTTKASTAQSPPPCAVPAARWQWRMVAGAGLLVGLLVVLSVAQLHRAASRSTWPPLFGFAPSAGTRDHGDSPKATATEVSSRGYPLYHLSPGAKHSEAPTTQQPAPARHSSPLLSTAPGGSAQQAPPWAPAIRFPSPVPTSARTALAASSTHACTTCFSLPVLPELNA